MGEQAVDGGGDAGLRRDVYRGRRLVEDQDERVLQQRPCDRDALPLAARERRPARADLGVEPPWQPGDQVVQLGARRRGTHRRLVRPRRRVADVVGDRPGEEDGILCHHRDVPAKRR